MKSQYCLVVGWMLLMVVAGCNKCSSDPKVVDIAQGVHDRDDVKKAITEGKLNIIEVKSGDGEALEAGKVANVHYTGWLTDGKKFDSSRDRGNPFSFSVGGGQVIRGWDEGVKGMKPGGQRILVIPADMGYGPNGYPGVIPPNATLLFEVELVKAP